MFTNKTVNGKQMLSNYKFFSSYSKFDKESKKYESWDDSVNRVFDQMHYIKFSDILNTNELFNTYYNFAKQKYKERYVLASQRSLQFGGNPILRHNSKLYNCTASYCDRPKFFQEAMYMLLSGCGVGFSVQNEHICKLPKIKKRSNRSKVHIIEDSIEGWSDAIGILISSFMDGDVPFPKYQNCYISFDYSEIRPKGSHISGGFKAPGSVGLRNTIQKIEELFETILDKPKYDGTLDSLTAYDIVMHMSDAVLSGGIRRAATICLFSPNDEKMLKAKTGNWFIDNPQRARSNNTVMLNKDTLTKEEFHKYFINVKEFGEPGFGFTTNIDILYNPCFEIAMLPKTSDGISGWQVCNLVEINGGQCKTIEEFYEACKAASIIGTMQAAYTDFKYLGIESKQICDREALIGVSITGFMSNPDILLNPEIQRTGAEIVKKYNKEVAEMIGINQAARLTCTKPSGNASVLLSTTSGIHGEHAPMYFRNVQANKEDQITKFLKEVNPVMFSESTWSANKTDYIISFPIINKDKCIYKDQLHGVKLLEYVKLTQQNWVEYGTNVELCTDSSLRHNVSNTIVVDNWEEVEDYIYNNRQYFSGISLLSMSGDKDYNQAPFIAILTPKEIIKKYGDAALFASGLVIDGIHAFNNNLWLACDTLLGIGEKLEYSENEVYEKLKFSTPEELWKSLGFKNGTLKTLIETGIKPEMEEYKRFMDANLITDIHNYALKKDWIRRAKQFAHRYFNSIKEMTYCLKDVNNYHRWIEINREMVNIDWDNLNEMGNDNDVSIDTLGAVACSGGSCEINF